MTTEEFVHPISRRLREAAVSLPEVNEGQACVNRSFKARKKGFFFLGEKGDVIRVMIKLEGSIENARGLADEEPDVWTVGTGGWVTGNFAAEEQPPFEVLEAWVEESYRLQAPKTLVAQLDAS